MVSDYVTRCNFLNNYATTRNRVADGPATRLRVVEMAGVEPASESLANQTSTSLAGCLFFGGTSYNQQKLAHPIHSSPKTCLLCYTWPQAQHLISLSPAPSHDEVSDRWRLQSSRACRYSQRIRLRVEVRRMC